MKSVSAIIVVKNSPVHLFETLASIDDFVSEIIIGNIDIGNSYKKKLQENKKVKIIDIASDVAYADLVKEDLKKNANGEYILYLDPDEIFPHKIKEFIIKNSGNVDYYLFPRKNIIFGKWIEHSRWWPDYQLRLFKKNAVVWPKELHPIPKGKGKEFRFEPSPDNSILHYNYDNMDQYLEKAVRYAKSEAAFIIQKNENFTLKQTLRKSLDELIGRFFSGEGYKDGMHGFVLSFLQMFYYFLVYFYYWEKKKYSNLEQNVLQNFQNFTHDLHFETNFWLIKKNLVAGSNKFKLKVKNIILKFFQ